MLHAINSDRQHNCWMSSDRLQYILGGGKNIIKLRSSKKLLNIIYVLISCTNIVSNIFIPRRIQLDFIMNLDMPLCKFPIILMRFWWKDLSRQIFEKSWNINFHENPSSESWVFPCSRTESEREGGERERDQRETGRRTDRYDEDNCRFSKFRERASYVSYGRKKCTLRDAGT